jgi:hypothetical protein
MPQSLDDTVIRVLNAKGETVGTAFLAGDCLAVTCAHVVDAAGSAPGSAISVCFYNQKDNLAAQVLAQPWSPVDVDDCAFLRLPSMPAAAQPLKMTSANRSEGHRYSSLGFPKQTAADARGALDWIVMVVHAAGKQDLLQLKGEEVYFGMSGAPVLDLDLDRVVGMITKGVDDKFTRFVYATTADTLCQFSPELHLEAPADEKPAVLAPASESYTISGSVSFEDGRPVAKASVRVIGLNLDPFITATDGFFQFTVADDPSWKVVATYNGMSVSAELEKAQLGNPLMLRFPHLACFSIDSPADNEQIPLGENQSRMIEGSFPILTDFPELASSAKIKLEVLKFPEGDPIHQTGSSQISLTQGKWYFVTAHFLDEGSYTVVATASIGKAKDFRRIQVQGIKKQEYYRQAIEQDQKMRGVENQPEAAPKVLSLSEYQLDLDQKQRAFFDVFFAGNIDQSGKIVASTLDEVNQALPLFPEDLYLQNVRAYTFKNYAMVMQEQDHLDECQRGLAEAEKMFRAILDQHPGDASAWNGLGSVSALRGDYTKALQYIEKALEILPDYPEALQDRESIRKALANEKPAP